MLVGAGQQGCSPLLTARRALWAIVIPLLLVACGSNSAAPVVDRNGSLENRPPQVMAPQHSPTPGPGEYYVQRGDTLYSIAWRQGFDFRRLAAANNIPPPYTIYTGQRLKLEQAPLALVSSVSGDQPAASPRSGESSVAQRPGLPAEPVAGGGTEIAARAPPGAATQDKPAPGVEPKPAGTTVLAKPVSAKPEEAETPAPKPAQPVNANPQGRWRWPADGRVVRRFSGTVHKGIDIGGRRGEPVRAVASGVVVYAGTGIVGFGELLIVKHDDTYLSAYGHNERLLVAEGSAVAAGQKVAEKGSSGTDSVKLHFEIRKNGKPIDPLQVLPKR